MRQPQLRTALPWVIGLSLVASLSCLAVAIFLVVAAGAEATQEAARQLSGQADVLARQIDRDLAVYDLTLREAARLLPAGVTTEVRPNFPLLDLPLTTSYLGFINILNEFGDVVADPRSNVSRPLNFKGRDYFLDQQKNAADIVIIGRPFATAANQNASIPISRRLTRSDGSFGGVVVAGVHLTWLSDLLSHPSPGPHPTITVRRGDGLVLMRAPYDQDAIGRTDRADPAWQAYLRTGLSQSLDDRTGIHLFHRLGAGNLVLELGLDHAEVAAGEPASLLWLPLLALTPGLCVLGLSLAAHHLQRHGDGVESAANSAYDESQRLLANMSHELRTPLTGILGQAELMTEEGGLTARQTERLKVLNDAGILMRNIVNRVIDVARPDDAVVPPPTACDLDPLLSSALGLVEGEARRKGLLLTSNVDTATPRRAMLEPDRVRQMLNNLLMNAIKFTERGSVALRVIGDSHQLRFEVADTGPGIPANKRNRLFRAYDRLYIPHSRSEGSGLGLSITERFARSLDGRVGQSPNPGGGSVFWFELPFIEPTAEANASPPPAPAPEFRHLRVLVADDSELTRAVTRDFLRSGGHAVTEVTGGEAAVELVRQQDFDVILTDMRMPVVNGEEVTRRIRALPGHRARTPIILVTADMPAIRAGEAGQTGVDLCVQKPFTRAGLLAAVVAAARLAPVPDAGSDNPALDTAVLADLQQTLGHEAFAAHLDAVTRRIAELIALLGHPNAEENPELGETAHDLVGVAGMMGLTALGSALRWFDSATDRLAPAAALREAARASLQALRRQQAEAVAGG